MNNVLKLNVPPLRKKTNSLNNPKILIQHHLQNSSKKALKENFGDGYLLKHNLLFRSTRQVVSDLGFRFTDQKFFTYDTLPFLNLDNIYKHKTIPFQKSFSLLKTVSQYPGYIVEELPGFNQLPNHVLHETCHAIVHALLKKAQGKRKPAKSKKEQRNLAILLSFLEESFANATEMLGIAFVHNSIHRDFYNFNSYTKYDIPLVTLLKKGIRTFGVHDIYKVLWYSYLYSNFMYQTFDEKTFLDIFNLANVNLNKKHLQAEMDLLKKICQIALKLNPGFKIVTNRAYFIMKYDSISLNKLLNFSVYDCLVNSGLQSNINEIIELILSEKRQLNLP